MTENAQPTKISKGKKQKDIANEKVLLKTLGKFVKC